MRGGIRKIALLGPESTGKSMLAAALAQHFSSLWVPEFARAYLQGLKRNYNEADVLTCARGQRLWEDHSTLSTSGPVFCDTEMINIHVWMHHKYGHSPKWVLEDLPQRYDFYLLTSPDLPFHPDPLRENSEQRHYFFDLYLELVKHYAIPFAVISGTGDERTRQAITAVASRME